MLELIVLEIIILVVALISSYLTWGPLTSTEMIILFGPETELQPEEFTPELLVARRKSSWFNESSRLLVLSLICTVLLTFYVEKVPVVSVLRHPLYQVLFVIFSLGVSGWCIYFGPRSFGLAHSGRFTFFSRHSFHIYIKPYLAWIPYGISVWGGLALFTIFTVALGIIEDVNFLKSPIQQVSAISSPSLKEFQMMTIALIDLGREMIVISQKYIISSLLTFVYLILEQRSNMRYTVRKTSIEWLKIAAWFGLFIALGFALIYQPRTYEVSHTNVQQELLNFANGQMSNEDLSYVIEIQQHLENHNVEWIVLSTLTGYGNILTLLFVGSSLLFWRAYLKDIPLASVLALLLPGRVNTILERVANNIKLDLNIENP